MKRAALVQTLTVLTLLAHVAKADEPPPLPSEPPPPAVIVATPASTSTAPAPWVAPQDRETPEGAPRYDLVRINAGFRVGYLPNRAFDTFSSNDVLPQFSIDGTYPLFTRGKLVVAAGLGWDVGGSSAKTRGVDMSVTAHRLYVPIEGRYYLTPWLAGFGKLAPGAAVTLASAEDPGANNLSGTGWAFAADASVGASILMGPRSRMDKRAIRFWLTPELGYAYTTNASLDASPGRNEEALLGSDESTKLRSLALSGFFWRASIGTTF